MEDPRIITEKYTIGDLIITLDGEQYKGLPILDTKVSIGNNTLCWISYPHKDDFLKELNDTISKYSI